MKKSIVKATAITVPDRSLKISLLRIRTGRCPACSRPRVGLRSAQRISPLSMRAMTWRPQTAPLPPAPFRRPDPVSRTHGPSGSLRDGLVFFDGDLDGLNPTGGYRLCHESIEPPLRMFIKRNRYLRARHHAPPSLSWIVEHTS